MPNLKEALMMCVGIQSVWFRQREYEGDTLYFTYFPLFVPVLHNMWNINCSGWMLNEEAQGRFARSAFFFEAVYRQEEVFVIVSGCASADVLMYV